MTEKEKLIEKEFKDIDQALRRAAQTARKLAQQTGTPYVVADNNSIYKLNKHDIPFK
jgi:Skp family chaperone for outer membrane proteins